MEAISDIAPNLNAQADPPFVFFILYDSFLAGHRAMEAYQKVLGQFGKDYAFNHHLWKLNVILSPEAQEFAASQLAEADAILISLHDPVLPPDFKQWLAHCVAQTDQKERALAVIFDRPGIQAKETEAWLRRLAEQRGTTFLSNEKEPEVNDLIRSNKAPKKQSEETTLLLANIVERQIYYEADGWGLND